MKAIEEDIEYQPPSCQLPLDSLAPGTHIENYADLDLRRCTIMRKVDQRRGRERNGWGIPQHKMST
jgi:hypothetical protein